MAAFIAAQRAEHDIPHATGCRALGVSQAWFTSLYNVLFGEARGPRFGSFVALYGVDETRGLIAAALSGALVAEHAAFAAGKAAPVA